MTQRTTLALAAAMTTFILVLIGGLAAYQSAQTQVAVAPTATAAPTATVLAPEPGLDPTAVAAAIKARDHAYQQRIQQANDQLKQSNQQLNQAYQKQQELATQLNDAYQQQRLLASQLKEANQRPPAVLVAAPTPQPTLVPPTSAPTAAPAPSYAVSADAAAAIALGAAPGAQLTRAPELISFQGAVAYEVVLDRGTLYVDANSGQILYDGTATVATGDHGGEHKHDDHEGDDDD